MRSEWTWTCLLGVLAILGLTGCPSEDRGAGEGERPGGGAKAARDDGAEGRGEPAAKTGGEAVPERGEPSPPSEAEPVDLLGAVPTEVSVSSCYRDEAAQISRLFDGDRETAWNSSTGDLEGAWIAIRLPESATLAGIEMTAGYTKRSGSRDLFTGNHRVRKVRVTRDGARVGEYDLDVDSRELQKLPVKGRGGLLKIELAELAPGSQAGWREACVSELRVLGTAEGARPGTKRPVTRIGEEAAPGGEGDAGPPMPADEGDAVDEGEEPEVDLPAPEITEADGIRLTRLELATAIESREPVDPRRRFSKATDDRIYCYMQLENGASAATKLQVSWERAGASSPGRGIALDIPARPTYTTFARTGMGYPPGRYQCVVRSDAGNVLGRIEFEIVE